MPLSKIVQNSIDSSEVLALSGIKFPATQSASADANTLDDYEEGSFTPGWNGGTVTVNLCRYIKIGKLVFANYDITFGTSASSSGALLDVPFAADNTPFQTGSFNYTDLTTTFITINIDNGAGATRNLGFRQALNGGIYACSSVASKRVIFSICYMASA